MSDIYVNIPCDDIMLEGTLSKPDDGGQYAGVAICHPHPLYGGDMYNNVIEAVYQELATKLFITLRFNFRGIGNSGGSVADSVGNLVDIGAAIDYLLMVEGVNAKRIGLVGYSYGAAIALRYVPSDERVKAVALISPSITLVSNDPIWRYNKHKYFISGEKDGVVSLHKFQYLVDKIADPKSYRIAAGVDHFWAGHEDVMANDVVSFLVRMLVGD